MLISTENTEDFWAKLLSLPSWERGLKCLKKIMSDRNLRVALLVGAWIEITISPASNIRLMSLPLWERGSSRFENEKFYIRLQINGVEDTAYLLCIIWSW